MNIKHIAGLTLIAGLSANSMAETLYNLDIDNTASLSYSVAGTVQTGVTVVATESFKVDRKVVFTLTPSTAIPSDAVNNEQGTAYTLVNDSNAPIRFALSAIHKDNAETVTINGTTVTDTTPIANAPTYTYYQETGAGTAFADASNAQLTTGYIELAPSNGAAGGSDEAIIYVVATPLIGVNQDIFAHELTVTAQETVASAAALTATNTPATYTAGDVITADTGAWVSGQTQTVLNADGATRVGEGAIEVTSAELTMTKTANILWDPINLFVDPRAIPGALVEYTITVTNIGSETATDVEVVDTLPGSSASGSGFNLSDGYAEAYTIDLNGAGANTATVTNTGTDDNTVTFDAFNVPAGENVAVTITATLQ